MRTEVGWQFGDGKYNASVIDYKHSNMISVSHCGRPDRACNQQHNSQLRTFRQASAMNTALVDNGIMVW